jgi:septal ring factor EnvC (AmiA/AmiB activator)
MHDLGEQKEWTVKNLEDFILRLKNYANRQYKAKDVLIFWVARAKLNKQLNKKLDKLLAMMSKDNKEMKAKREVVAKQIETDYQARKKKYPAELPKYLFATRLDLDIITYRNIVATKDIIKPDEMKEFFNREQIHRAKRL